jgi:hypothetical protein
MRLDKWHLGDFCLYHFVSDVELIIRIDLAVRRVHVPHCDRCLEAGRECSRGNLSNLMLACGIVYIHVVSRRGLHALDSDPLFGNLFEFPVGRIDYLLEFFLPTWIPQSPTIMPLVFPR